MQTLLVNEQRLAANQDQVQQMRRLESRLGKSERAYAGLRAEKEALAGRSTGFQTLSNDHAALQAQVLHCRARQGCEGVDSCMLWHAIAGRLDEKAALDCQSGCTPLGTPLHMTWHCQPTIDLTIW